MNITKLDRTALKSYFVKNAIPTASNFADLIDGLLNQKEDGIAKLPGEPLSVQADGEQRNVINFYNSFGDAKAAWTMSLNPRIDPNLPAAKAGWSVGDGDGRSRLFIDATTGNIGIGTVAPLKRLHVVANVGDHSALLENTNPGGYGVIISAAVDPLRVGGLGQQYGERLIVKGNGNVGIGTTAPQATLHVGGSVKIDGVNVLEFGSGVASKEPNAGRIGYQTFTANALDVVGAGTNGTNRRIKFWAEGGATIEGTLGIGTAAPAGKLEVIGTAVISNGNTYATKNNRMAAGSLSVGSIDTSYGGGNSWNANTAGLLLETIANTEIAVHDSNTRLASLMYYEGDSVNRITIGRNMGFGTIGQLVLNGDVTINGTASIPQQVWQIPTFLNAWHNYGNPFNSAGYFKDSMGIVHLKGLVAGGAAGTTVFVLPPGYRPAAQELHVTATNDTTGRLDVTTAGELKVVAGSPNWFSLDGITFKAESVVFTIQAIPLQAALG